LKAFNQQVNICTKKRFPVDGSENHAKSGGKALTVRGKAAEILHLELQFPCTVVGALMTKVSVRLILLQA
jgi:hypothetical protein